MSCKTNGTFSYSKIGSLVQDEQVSMPYCGQFTVMHWCTAADVFVRVSWHEFKFKLVLLTNFHLLTNFILSRVKAAYKQHTARIEDGNQPRYPICLHLIEFIHPQRAVRVAAAAQVSCTLRKSTGAHNRNHCELQFFSTLWATTTDLRVPPSAAFSFNCMFMFMCSKLTHLQCSCAFVENLPFLL